MMRSLAFLFLAHLMGCGSSPAQPTTSRTAGPINDGTLAEACAEARHQWNCKVAASAEGDIFHSCECKAFKHVTGVQAMNLEGVDEDDGHVDRDYELQWRDGRWHLGPIIDRPSMYDEEP